MDWCLGKKHPPHIVEEDIKDRGLLVKTALNYNFPPAPLNGLLVHFWYPLNHILSGCVSYPQFWWQFWWMTIMILIILLLMQDLRLNTCLVACLPILKMVQYLDGVDNLPKCSNSKSSNFAIKLWSSSGEIPRYDWKIKVAMPTCGVRK